ncbi:LuxR C-terminal-related transcriptional regulator [Streptacidiphilus sp. N1-12]|uniref:LuxR C-terminal-related transcriptional regulator n=2 Tax=Streptacidiphilus alkalitolerans TaxID=3342712 RepID=A0ABV6WP41_9ACTN
MARIRVLVADGHRIFAEALATALAAEPDVEVAAAGTAAAAERALDRAAGENRPFQVLLVDADLVPGSPAAPSTTANAARRLLPPQRPGPVLPAQRQSSAPPAAPAGPAASAGKRIPAPRDAEVPEHGAPNTAGAPAGPAEPAEDGITLVARARAAHPSLQAVVLAVVDDPHRVVAALQAGASGWVAKESSLGRLMAVVRGVLREETHIPPLLLTGVIRELTAARRDRTESERLIESLTPREKQVLRCMVAGLGRQAVADRLYLSPHTVRTHMQNVLGKLGVHSTLAAVAVARRAGVGPVD